MSPRPFRLAPGADLRGELERLAREVPDCIGFVLAGIGSIGSATLRLANQSTESILPGPHEVLTLCGSPTRDGAHLHISVANGSGQVFGGHLCVGNRVRTTVEGVLLATPQWSLKREEDPATGHKELLVAELPRQDGSPLA